MEIKASITTASDLHYNVALDAPPDQFYLANTKDYKSFMKNLLSGEEVSLDGYLPWLKNTGIPVSHDGKLKIRSTHQNEIGNQFELIYNSESLAVGVGCERGTSINELISLVQTTLENNNLSKASVAVFVSIEQKMDEIAINAVADFFNLSLIHI